jgi:very-short-patch-repair endonuclease
VGVLLQPRRRFKRRLHLTTPEFAHFLRVNATKYEKLLWAALQGQRCGGVEFKFQEPVLGWVADFLAPSLKLIVEVDGRGHQYGRQKAHDAVRDHVLATQGYTTVRYTNDEVLFELPIVIRRIQELTDKLGGGDHGRSNRPEKDL